MDLAKTVAMIRFKVNANLIEAVNVGNQLKLISDDRAEALNKRRCMEIFEDILPRIYGQEAVNKLVNSSR